LIGHAAQRPRQKKVKISWFLKDNMLEMAGKKEMTPYELTYSEKVWPRSLGGDAAASISYRSLPFLPSLPRNSPRPYLDATQVSALYVTSHPIVRGQLGPNSLTLHNPTSNKLVNLPSFSLHHHGTMQTPAIIIDLHALSFFRVCGAVSAGLAYYFVSTIYYSTRLPYTEVLLMLKVYIPVRIQQIYRLPTAYLLKISQDPSFSTLSHQNFNPILAKPYY
jgi:hypothetical protein